MTALYSLIYMGMRAFSSSEKNKNRYMKVNNKVHQSKLLTEFSGELTDGTMEQGKDKSCKKECNKCKKN